MRNLIQKINRARAYAQLDLTRKQVENCLVPLWEIGNATSQEIAAYLNKPINEVVGRFRECWEKGFIDVYAPRPVKKNSRTGKSNTNYVLTKKGKDAVRKLIGYSLQQEKTRKGVA